MLAETEKKDYMEALRRNKPLVEAEGDPIKFLRTADFNPWYVRRFPDSTMHSMLS